jgi:hypothetical protein
MVVDLSTHWQALLISDEVREWDRRMYRPMTVKIQGQKIVRLLTKAKVKFVVLGTHALNGWRDQPRATQDVDILAKKGHYEKAIATIQAAFPRLELRRDKRAVHFADPASGLVAIDVFRQASPLLVEVFKHRVQVNDYYSVPDFEAMLVIKFVAFVSPERKVSRRYLDAGDMINVIENNSDSIDLAKIKALWRLEHKDNRILRFIREVRSGRHIKIDDYF